MPNDFIKEYWEKQGETHKDSHWASWGDNWMIDLEIEVIGSHLTDDKEVLDIGCANGFSTFKQLEAHKLKSITGVDYSENMIAAALEAKAKRGLGDIVNFEVGDIRSLRFPDARFDVVYTTRVLINLPTWSQQVGAINECIRVTRAGGKIVLSEGFWEPLILLNALRALKQLPPLVEHDFNRYLKKQRVEDHLRSLNLTYQIEDFSSIYYLGSRFVRELVTDPSAYPGFTNPINEIFFKIEREFSGGGFGIQQAVIIQK